MESTGNIVPSSGQTTPSPIDLHVLLVHQGGVVVSMFAKKIYVCLHKVAMAPSNMVDQVLRILREKVCLCEGIICEEASSAAPTDNALLQTIMNLASESHIHNFKVVSQDHSLARIWKGTSDACVYTSKGDMVYGVQMRRRANQMMEHQRISSSSVAIGSSEVASANNNNNEITTAASDIEGVRRNYSSSSDQQLAEATGSDHSSPPTKKQRCVWTPQLHGAFQEAFNDLASVRAAVPKKILEWMKRKKNIPDWINRENIASHLQKYRKSIAKQQSQPTIMQQGQGGLLTDIPTSSRSISNPTKTSTVAPVVMPSCRSDTAICNISGLDRHSALGIGEAGYNNLTRSSTMDLMHLNEQDPYQMSQGMGRDPSASGLGEVDWSNFLMSQLNGYGHQYCSDEVLRSLVNRFEHHYPNHDSMFGRRSIQHGLSFITNDQHNGGIGLGQQCPNPGEVGLFNQRSSFIANDQHNNGGTGFRQQLCPNTDSVGLVNQYGSSFIANDQTYNAGYVPVGNVGFDFGQQQQPNQNYNSEVQNNSALPNVGQQVGSTIIQNYKAEVHINSFLPNVAQQGGSTIIQNYNPEVQINSVPSNVAQQRGSTSFINTVPAKPI